MRYLCVTDIYLLFSETFKRVAELVSGVKLQDHVVDVVFKMFDENGKYQLYAMFDKVWRNW